MNKKKLAYETFKDGRIIARCAVGALIISAITLVYQVAKPEPQIKVIIVKVPCSHHQSTVPSISFRKSIAGTKEIKREK
jgi:hypothetical protein